MTHVEVTHREIANDWLKSLNIDLETLYKHLSQLDETARKSWQEEVRRHPFELSEQELLGDFDAALDLEKAKPEEIALLKRTLIMDLVEHRAADYAAETGIDPRTFALGLLETARSFSNGSFTFLRDQARQFIEEPARQAKERDAKEGKVRHSDEEWGFIAADARAAMTPEVMVLILIDKEEKRRAGEVDMRAFNKAAIQSLRETPALLTMQTSEVDPDVDTVTAVIEKASLPPKEATYALNWLREAGDPPSHERLRASINELFPTEPDLSIQRRAALERVLQLIEAYPQSMLTPHDVGLPPEDERIGRPSRMNVQLRRAIADDMAIKPDIDEGRRAHDRAYARQMRDVEHGLAVYEQQTLPKMLVQILTQYHKFADARTSESQQAIAKRLALRLSERGSDLGETASAATQRIMRFLEQMHRTWHGDGERVSAFLDTLRPEVEHFVQARLDDAALASSIEEASFSLATTRTPAETAQQQAVLADLRRQQKAVKSLLASYENAL